jgi:hypothetical protein
LPTLKIKGEEMIGSVPCQVGEVKGVEENDVLKNTMAYALP